MIAPLAAALVMTCSTFGATDGDTLRGCGERVRLFGIQAPEARDPGGPEATAAMSALITGKVVECYAAPNGQRRDRYRRLVALCTVNGRDIAADMVRQGHAQDYPTYSRGFYRQEQR
jgi:endonuclease YncB( thermonuclease family)